VRGITLALQIAVSAYLPSNGTPGNHTPVLVDRLSASSSGPYAPPSEESVDWRRYGAAVLRYRWWILGFAALGTLGGTAAGRLLPPRYQAQATIWIQSSDPRGTSRGPIGANQLLESYAWIDLLKSYIVLDQVARELRLYLAPERGSGGALAGFTVGDTYEPGRYRLVVDRAGSHFRLTGARGEELQQGAIGDSVGPALGFRWTPAADVLPAGSDFAFTVRPLRDAAKGLGNALTVTIDQGGNFLRVGLTGEDPARTAATVNAVAQRYVTVGAELKRAKLNQLGKLLDEQRQAARGNLQRAESALEQLQVATLAPGLGAAPVPSSGGSLSPLATLLGPKLEQEQLSRDRGAIEQVLVQIRDSGGSADGLAFIGAVQRSTGVSQALRDLTAKEAEQRALRSRYTDDHPAVQRLTREIELLERSTIPTLARSLIAELTAREGVLAPQIAAGDRELRQIPQRAIEEARRRRDVDLATNLYTGVQQRYDEARLAEASSIADVRILDAAVAPQEPLKDVASRFIMLGLAAGLGLGLVGAVVGDRLDPRMRYPDQVTRQMGLPILGVLPHVKDRGALPGDEHVAHVIEAMRSVRLSLVHFYGGNGPVVFTVTSPGVGDGKSFVSANLALACAEAGQPTLLIDGDARRGGLHRVMHRSRKPGLTDCLAGAAPLEAIIQNTLYPSLDFIGAGSRFGDSPELLGSPAMVALLERVRAQYRVVVVDSPPLGSGVDPYTLGIITGNLLLVLRTGTTNLGLARTKLAVLDHLPIRLLGVVLNDVQAGGMYRYYSYISGYATADEREGYAVAGRRARGVL
jgi:capsular exopolysaccharide synthesis family protein